MKYCLLSFLSILAISCGAGKSSSTSSTQNASNSNKDNILVSNNQDPNSVPTQPESQSLSLEEFLKKFSGSTPYTAFNLNSEYKITKEHLEKINEDYKRYDWSRLVIPTKISFQPAVFENNKKYDSLPVSWFSAIEKATISERDVHITKNIQSLIKSHQEGELLIIIAGQQHSYDTYWNDPKQAITYFFHPLRSNSNPYLFSPGYHKFIHFMRDTGNADLYDIKDETLNTTKTNDALILITGGLVSYIRNVINQKTSTDIQKLLEGSTPPNSQIWFFGDRHYLNNTEIANSFPSLDELKSHGITSIKIAIEAIPYREHSSTSFDLLSEYDFENTIFPVLIRTMPNNQLNLFNLFKSEEIVRAPNIHAILQKIKMYSKDIPVTFNGIE